MHNCIGFSQIWSHMMILTQIGPLLCSWDMILLYLIVADTTGGNKEVESVRSIVRALRLPPRMLQLSPLRVLKMGQLS